MWCVEWCFSLCKAKIHLEKEPDPFWPCITLLPLGSPRQKSIWPCQVPAQNPSGFRRKSISLMIWPQTIPLGSSLVTLHFVPWVPVIPNHFFLFLGGYASVFVFCVYTCLSCILPLCIKSINTRTAFCVLNSSLKVRKKTSMHTKMFIFKAT